MALLDLAEPAGARAVLRDDAPARRLPEWADDVAVMAVLLWFGTLLVLRTGGRDPHVVSVGLVLVGVSLLLVQPWHRLRPTVFGGLSAVSVASFGVVLTAPTGWSGANEAASWVFASQIAAVVMAWARDEKRRMAVLALLGASAMFSFASGWRAWWGGENPTKPFIGTFYWHNQEGAFLAMGALVGALLVVSGAEGMARLGWLMAPLCGAGVILTTSRGSLITLGLGLFLLGCCVLLRGGGRLRGLVRLGGLAGLTWATAVLITGPPFFTHRVSPLAATQVRSSSGQSVATNSHYRLEDWRNAWRVFLNWPLSGVGFHGFASASARVDPAHHGSRTPFAHNGFLQLLVDGGVLLALPVLGLLVALAVVSVRTLRSKMWTGLGSATLLVGLAFHSAIDFDWSYPALLAAFAVIASVLGGPSALAEKPPRRWWSWPAALTALLLVAVACIAAWHGSLHLNVPVGAHS